MDHRNQDGEELQIRFRRFAWIEQVVALVVCE